MSLTDYVAEEIFAGSSYDIIPWFHRQEVLFYREFGSYQGDWMIVSFNHATNEYVFWTGGYGSCSGCDHFQDAFDYKIEGAVTRSHPDVIKFMEDYTFFLEVPKETMANVVIGGAERLKSLMPKNAFRDYWDGEKELPDAFETIALICKLNEGVDVTARDIFDCANAEVRRRAMETYGEDRWLSEMKATQLHRDECGVLYQVEDRRYVMVQDASTPRRFLLHVPEDDTRLRPRGQRSTQPLDTARAAVAWTFGLTADEYQPSQQT